MKTKIKAQWLQYFARKSSQQGMTLVNCLLLIVIIMILASHLGTGSFADSIDKLGMMILNSSNYEYSIEKTPLATFQYGTSLQETFTIPQPFPKPD